MDYLIGCFAFCVFIAVTQYIMDQQDIKKKNSKSRKKRRQNSEEETEGRGIFKLWMIPYLRHLGTKKRVN